MQCAHDTINPMAHKTGIKRVNLPLVDDADTWADFRATAIRLKIDLAIAADQALRNWIRRMKPSVQRAASLRERSQLK